MRIGLVSDTHDNAPVVEEAVRAFHATGVAFVLHAGDVTRPHTLASFRAWPGAVVLGNNDRDVADLERAAADMGWAIGESWTGELGGLRMAVAHGHRRGELTRLARPAETHVLVRGHSHRVQDEVVDGVRVLNPGALFRARTYTIAVLDTDTGELTRVTLPKPG